MQYDQGAPFVAGNHRLTIIQNASHAKTMEEVEE